MMKAGAIGRLGDVTKLLQTQRRESVAYVCARAFPPFSDESKKSQVRRYHPGGKFLKSVASQSPPS